MNAMLLKPRLKPDTSAFFNCVESGWENKQTNGERLSGLAFWNFRSSPPSCQRQAHSVFKSVSIYYEVQVLVVFADEGGRRGSEKQEAPSCSERTHDLLLKILAWRRLRQQFHQNRFALHLKSNFKMALKALPRYSQLALAVFLALITKTHSVTQRQIALLNVTDTSHN